jgi:osmotically-inducible protein OsmY
MPVNYAPPRLPFCNPPARPRRLLACAAVGLLALAGCNRQDTECLARIGHKVMEHAEANGTSLRDRLDANAQGLARPAPLRDKVADRLRWDSQLADAKIEVTAGDAGEVDLTGTVKSDDQRRRAVELTETTVGVQSVNVRLEVVGAEPMP